MSEELARDFINSALDARDLLRRLQRLLTVLRAMPQDVEETQVEAAALALAHKKLLGHKDDGVRAAVAGCLAEVLRVYAPKTPYDDKAQMAIFALFLAQSAALKRVHGPGYDAAVELYVRLAEIKAMVLLVFLDGPLALRAFRELFECVRKEHFELGVAETLLTVLCDMVNEMDTVPAEVLHVVFQNLVGQDTYPEAYQLAKHLVMRCAAPLEGPVSADLLDQLTSAADAAVNSDALAQPFRLCRQLFVAAPDMLLHVLPQLERALVSERETYRREAVKTLAAMFSAPQSKMHVQSVGLLSAFLDRCHDKEAVIRCHVVGALAALLVHHAHENAALASDVRARLSERSRDQDETVRLRSVESIMQVAREQPSQAPLALLRDVGERCVDSRAPVHTEAVRALAQLFHDWTVRSAEPTVDEVALYAWIPAQLLMSWKAVPALVEDALDAVLLGPASDTDALPRAHRLIRVLFSVSDHAEAQLQLAALLRAKRDAQRSWATLLDLAQRKALDADDEKQFSAAVQVLSHAVPGADGGARVERVQQLFKQLRTSAVAKAARVLVDPAASLAELRKAEEHLVATLKKAVSGKPAAVAFGCLVRRVSNTLCNCETVPQLMLSLDEYRVNDDAESQTSLLQLLRVVSEVFPALFAPSVDALCAYVQARALDDSLRALALGVLANCDASAMEAAPAALRGLSKQLVRMATRGSGHVELAKLAALALVRLFPAQERDALLQQVYAVVVPLPPQDDPQALLAALAVLGVLLERAPQLFADSDTESLLVDVLERLSEEEEEEEQQQQQPARGQVSARSQCRVAAVKLVARHAVSTQNQPGRVLPLLARLEHLLGAESVESATDAAALRVAAAAAVLRLACERPLEELVSPALFANLVWSMQHRNAASVQAVLAKYRKRCVRLPPRYLCLPVVAAQGAASAAAKSDAARVLADAIEAKRKWMDTMLARVAGDEGRSRVVRQLAFPEFALPHLVHVLAHWPGFDADRDNAAVRRWLKAFLEALLRKTDHVSFVLQYLGQLASRWEDAADPPRNEAIAAVCERATELVKQLSDARAWKPSHEPLTITIPGALYRVKPEASAVIARNVASASKALAASASKRASETPVSGAKSARRKSAATMLDFDAAAKEEQLVQQKQQQQQHQQQQQQQQQHQQLDDDEEAVVRKPSNKSKAKGKSSFSKKRASEDDESESQQEQEQPRANSPAPAAVAKKKKSKGANAAAAASEPPVTNRAGKRGKAGK